MTVLTHAEKNSALWVTLKSHMESRIAELRSRMESLNTPIEEMDGLRHRIKELRQLIGIENNEPQIEAPTDVDGS